MYCTILLLVFENVQNNLNVLWFLLKHLNNIGVSQM